MNKKLALPLLLLLAGCATAPAPVKFPVSPKMATACAEGETTFSWKSDMNQTYTIYYTDAPHGARADWKPLRQANNLRGNGNQITVSDKVSPDCVRRYLLLSGNEKP